MQLVRAAPSGSTPGITALAFHAEPRDQIPMGKFAELWLSLWLSLRATEAATMGLQSISWLSQIPEVLERDEPASVWLGWRCAPSLRDKEPRTLRFAAVQVIA